MRLFFSFIIACTALLNAQARTMKDLFISMPDSLLSTLPQGSRLDLIDYINSGMKATAKNAFGEPATLDVINDTYARVQTSPVSSYEWKLLVEGADSVVCQVATYKYPLEESTVAFFSTNWKPLNSTRILTLPKLKDFLTQTQPERIGTENLSAHLSEADNTLTFHLRCDNGDPELFKELKDALRPEIRYTWTKGRFSK